MVRRGKKNLRAPLISQIASHKYAKKCGRRAQLFVEEAKEVFSDTHDQSWGHNM